MTKTPNARELALTLLEEVLDRRRPLDEALGTLPHFSALEARDRAFLRRLAASTLRRLGEFDHLIDRCLERPLKPSHRRTRHILRLGAAQLLALETPPHAAVAETVALARGREAGRRGLVNAVLRRLARESAELSATLDREQLNTPPWLWERWCSTYGEEITRAIARQHLTEPPLDLTVKESPEKWAERLGANLLPSSSLRIADPSGEITALPGFEEGTWWVQDAAAALPAHLLGEVAGKRVIDLCAAPGGKTAQLAAAGAQVLAVDRSRPRLARLEENMRRLGLNVEIYCGDATTWQPPELADAILLDAPCSATGTLRRHPDIAWLKTPDDLAKLVDLQARLLQAAVRMLRPGGLLVFATCSLEPEEGSLQIEALLAREPAFERLAVRAEEIGGLAEAVTPEGALRTLPCHLSEMGGMDGFYACRLRRRESAKAP